MNLNDIINVAINIGNRVNYYWSFFVTVNTVIIGWLITVNINFTTELKVVITIPYGNFY